MRQVVLTAAHRAQEPLTHLATLRQTSLVENVVAHSWCFLRLLRSALLWLQNIELVPWAEGGEADGAIFIAQTAFYFFIGRRMRLAHILLSPRSALHDSANAFVQNKKNLQKDDEPRREVVAIRLEHRHENLQSKDQRADFSDEQQHLAVVDVFGPMQRCLDPCARSLQDSLRRELNHPGQTPKRLQEHFWFLSTAAAGLRVDEKELVAKQNICVEEGHALHCLFGCDRVRVQQGHDHMSSEDDIGEEINEAHSSDEAVLVLPVRPRKYDAKEHSQKSDEEDSKDSHSNELLCGSFGRLYHQ